MASAKQMRKEYHLDKVAYEMQAVDTAAKLAHTTKPAYLCKT